MYQFIASVEHEIVLDSSSIGIQSTQPLAGQIKLAEAVETGVTSGVREGVIVIIGVGVTTGTSALGIGRKRAARTPMRIPKRIKAIPIKKIRRKPEELDDEGTLVIGSGGIGGVSWYIGWEIDSGGWDWEV